MKRLLPLLPAAALLAPALAAPDNGSGLKASPQSIECFYPRESGGAGKAAPACTLRLHLTAGKGAQLWMRRGKDVPPAPLAGKDAEGNLLVGVFREWESCYEATGKCGIMVYDFYARPRGGWIAFDTDLEVPVTKGAKECKSEPFSLAREAVVCIAGRMFRISPAGGEESGLLLKAEYEADPDLAGISFLSPKGKKISGTAIESDFHEQGKRNSATYALAYKGEKAILAARIFRPREIVRVPLRFKSSIGYPVTAVPADSKQIRR